MDENDSASIAAIITNAFAQRVIRGMASALFYDEFGCGPLSLAPADYDWGEPILLSSATVKNEQLQWHQTKIAFKQWFTFVVGHPQQSFNKKIECEFFVEFFHLESAPRISRSAVISVSRFRELWECHEEWKQPSSKHVFHLYEEA